MKTNLLSLLFFVFAFGNSFAQQIIILPNWNVGESKNLKITSINPREKEEDYDENTDYHVNEDKNSKNKASESIETTEKLIIDTIYLNANWKVIAKTDAYYEMEWQYTNFEMNRFGLDEYTLEYVKIYDALAKCPPVRYQMGLDGKFLGYSKENGLEAAIKEISSILNVDYETQTIDENGYIIDSVDAFYDEIFDDEGNKLDNEGNIIESKNEENIQESDFSFSDLDFFLVRSTMESVFTERIEKIHSFFGDTCKIGIKKDISELDIKELEDLEKMKGMFDIAGNLLVTEVANHYNYIFLVNMEMGDFIEKMMESIRETFEENDEGKKKKKRKVNEYALNEKKILKSFQMNMAIDGEMNLSKNTFWPLDLFYTLTVKGNVMENKENKGFDVTSSEKIIFK